MPLSVIPVDASDSFDTIEVIASIKEHHHKFDQGCIYSFGEEGMQLVQPSKFTIFRTRSRYWHAHVRTWAILVTLKNFDVCTVTMGVAWELHALFSEGVYMPLV